MSDLEDSTVTYTEAPPSPDYVLGPEEPEQAPPPPDFVPEPIYPKLMPPEDDVLLAEEQPLPAAVSPTADSLGYITKSDPEEDPKEDDEDPEEDPTDFDFFLYGYCKNLKKMVKTGQSRTQERN
ncbi:hypothetical protein Tco_0410037 [Tanacetum coccineum]